MAPLASMTAAVRPGGRAAVSASSRGAAAAPLPVRPPPHTPARAVATCQLQQQQQAPRGHASNEGPQQQEQQAREGGRSGWAVPLAAGAMLLRLARSAAGHLLPSAGAHAGQAPHGLSDARVFPSLVSVKLDMLVFACSCVCVMCGCGTQHSALRP